jgi:hypothetical protein
VENLNAYAALLASEVFSLLQFNAEKIGFCPCRLNVLSQAERNEVYMYVERVIVLLCVCRNEMYSDFGKLQE